MRKNSRIVAYTFPWIVAVLAVLVLTGCKGPQGPDWKQQVSLALDHFNKGEEELKKNNIDAAEQEYLTSLEISPRPITYVRLAQIKSTKNDVSGAIADLDRALKLAPNFQRAITFKKQIQLRQQGVDGASEVSSEEAVPAELIQPSAPVMMEERKTEEPIPAESMPEESIPSETTKPEPVSEPKSTTIAPEKPQPAAAVAVKAEPEASDAPKAESIPSENEALLREAQEAFNKGDWAAAQAKYMKVIENNPKSAIVQYNYGYACIQQNRFEEARSAFQQAVELDPKFTDAFNDLGVTLEKLNRSGEAANAYQKAVDLGGNSDAFFNLALLKEKQGKYKDSVELYEKYLELDANSQLAGYARQRIENLRRLAY